MPEGRIPTPAGVMVLVVSVLLALTPAAIAATVDGLLLGDEAEYAILGEDPGRAVLYWARDGSTLYVLLRVDPGVNDNVFGSRFTDQPYLSAAGWTTGNHRFRELEKSDHLVFDLSCGGRSYNWSLDYVYDEDHDLDPLERDWRCDVAGPDGFGTPPPGLVSSSSLAWNMNNTSWDVTLGGQRADISSYKSPDPMVGYPGFDAGWQWEWSMIYEMSIDVSVCQCESIQVAVSPAHNSPSKDGDPNIYIPGQLFGPIGAAAGPDVTTCKLDSVVLDASGSMDPNCPGGLLYEWRDGPIVVRPASPDPRWVPPTQIDGTKSYTVVVTCAELPGCEFTDEVVVAVRDCTLAVQFDRFTARRAVDGSVVVEWSTLLEDGTSAFVVERSDHRDGSFASVGATVRALGPGVRYQLIDSGAASSPGWYRVRELTTSGGGDATPAVRVEEGGFTTTTGTSRGRSRSRTRAR